MHSIDSIHEAATLWDGRGEDTGVPVAGVGAPLVAEFSICEFAAALGVPTQVGKVFLGEALELCYRLGRVWRRVQAGQVPGWRARRIAALTIALSPEAAAYVDRHVGPVAHKVGPVQTERLVAEAIARFMPDAGGGDPAEGGRWAALHDRPRPGLLCRHQPDLGRGGPGRRPGPGRRGRGPCGPVEGPRLHRVAGRAAGDRGRRAGPPPASLRPAQPADEPTIGDGIGGRAASASERVETPRTPHRKPRRQVVLYVHLSEHAITGAGSPVGRVENAGNRPVTAEQIRTWCGHPDTNLVVKPVVDLADHVHVTAYEVPDRIAEAVGATGPDLCLPLVHPPRPQPRTGRAWLRLRPRHPPSRGRADLLVSDRALVPATSPGQDPHRLALHHPRTRHLPVEHPARDGVPPRPRRHPRHHPRPPRTRRPAGDLTTPPHTPPTNTRAGAGGMPSRSMRVVGPGPPARADMVRPCTCRPPSCAPRWRRSAGGSCRC